MKRIATLMVALGASALLPVHAAQVTVFAAASLSDALKEVGRAYEKETGVKVVYNFGASSLLARQIEAGAPADLFFSADEAKMDDLEKKGLIVAGTRRSRWSNALVIVVAADRSREVGSAQDLARPVVKRVALAEPRTVPAGIYARTYLERLGLWGVVAPKVVPTDNVRGALAAVESGNVDAGMVYKTDAAMSRKVRVVYEVPARESPKISYPMAVVSDTRQPEAARRLLRHLESAEVGRVFARHGFVVVQ